MTIHMNCMTIIVCMQQFPFSVDLVKDKIGGLHCLHPEEEVLLHKNNMTFDSTVKWSSSFMKN